MKETSDLMGSYVTVFDGSDNYPDITTYLKNQGVSAGTSYLFRVKARYINGFTEYSEPSLQMYACAAPSMMQAPSILSLSKTQFTIRWSQPQNMGSCDLYGYKLFINDGNGGD
jgi:hypothetical protein